MGYVITQLVIQPYLRFALLVASSCMLYLSGMVLNDVFDAPLDALERPDRPIPSGRVSLRAAKRLGFGLWLGGVLAAAACSLLANDWRPVTVSVALAVVILLYNSALKGYRIAPLLMGECRFLNVLLGMSLFVWRWEGRELLIALGIGCYTLGVTIFSRTDNRRSTRSRLISGFVVIVASLVLLAGTPNLTAFRPPLEMQTSLWYALWLAVGLITVRRCIVAIFDPSAARVQTAVRHCVQSIIVLDAAVCLGYVGPFWAFAVLSLLIPTFVLTQWLQAT
jgi:4-hydroxybenzoate polyprenyltransferase